MTRPQTDTTGVTKPYILVVEDDQDILDIVVAYLEHHSFGVGTASEGRGGLIKALTEKPDLVVLDWLLPGLDGLEFISQLRQEQRTPIIMLTSKRQEEDRVLGLDSGADDYLAKPFSPRELVSRIHAVLRRSKLTSEVDDAVLTRGLLMFDPSKRSLRVDNTEVDLTALEFDLLLLLARHPGRVFRRDELLSRLWEEDADVFDRLVDMHVYNLRKKLSVNSDAAASLQTVRGVGYRFVEHPE